VSDVTLKFVELAERSLKQRDLLVKALEQIAAIENREFGLDWEEIEEARHIARGALAAVKGAPDHD
jgi:hypothetical protein